MDDLYRFWHSVFLKAVFAVAATLLGKANSPLSGWLVRHAARRLPVDLAYECECQWLADLHDLPPWLRLKSALSILGSGREIAAALEERSRSSLRRVQHSNRLDAASVMIRHEDIPVDVPASFDALTGLDDAASLQRRLRALSSPLRLRRRKFSVVMLDIDDFNAINRLLGDLGGNALLREFGRRLRRSLRRRAYLGRLSGEHFVVILPNTSPSMTREIAERLRFACQMSLVVSIQRVIAVSASVGMVTDTRGLASAEILNCAQEALSSAKTEGRNCIREFAA